MKRQSTTVKVTRTITYWIIEYVHRYSEGVIVRHRGKEYGVVGVESQSTYHGFAFRTLEGVILNPSECTVRKGINHPKLVHNPLYN